MPGLLERDPITSIPGTRGKSAIERAINRMEAEYREMPGLILTPRQAQRLLGLDETTCGLAIATLTRRRFLKQTSDGAYVRERPG